MTSGTPIYPLLERITPWVCVDLEINPETREFTKGAILYKKDNEPPASKTYDSNKRDELVSKLKTLLAHGATLIGHNLRRHDLVWLTKWDNSFGKLDCCIDTLEIFPIAFPSVRSYALEKAYRQPVDDPLIGPKRLNHPALDCAETCRLLERIIEWVDAYDNGLKLNAYHMLLGHAGPFANGYRKVFTLNEPAIDPLDAFENALAGGICSTSLTEIRNEPLSAERARSLAYLLSVIPSNQLAKPLPLRPWVVRSHPETKELLQKLRGTNCGQCEFCAERFDLLRQMGNLFQFNQEPSWRNDGQRMITEAVMSGKDAIGVLPTSGGKSLAFQLPALIKANTTGELTVVLSPLRSLMRDQVEKLMNEHSRTDVCQISGDLNSLERKRNLNSVQGVKLDSAASKTEPDPAHIVYMAPEQLRSVSVIRALATRGIGLLVVDEAHCIAKWGKDFRVDYRFIPELIERFCSEHDFPKPPVLCLTATARKDVLNEIAERFQLGLGKSIQIMDYGHARKNLSFECLKFPEGGDAKYDKLLELLGGTVEKGHAALVFCSTRRTTKNIAKRIERDLTSDVDYYHGDCDDDHRKRVQDNFVQGELKIVVATNAFGMGVDKKDIRLVVHYDIPGSIENYIQEAGRAGRDDKPARCILLYDPQDLDTQLDMRRRNQLRRHELKRIMLYLRLRYKQNRKDGDELQDIVISARDLLRARIDHGNTGDNDPETKDEEAELAAAKIDDEEANFHQKVITALGILEEGHHLERLENVFAFVGVPFRITNWDKILEAIQSSTWAAHIKTILRNAAEYLFDKYIAKDRDSTVDLEVMADQLNIGRGDVREHIDQLRGIGVCNWNVEFVIDWYRQTKNSSDALLKNRLELITVMLKGLEESPVSYASENDPQEIDLHEIRKKSRSISKSGYGTNLNVSRDLRLLKEWGLFEIDARKRGIMLVRWKGGMDEVKERLGELQRVCHAVLQYLDENQQSTGFVTSKFNYPAFERWHSSRPGLFGGEIGEDNCTEALLFMHYRKIITVVDGFSVLRARMKIKPNPGRILADYNSAYKLYEEYIKSTISQVKAMQRFAERLAKSRREAMDYLDDYFKLSWDDFSHKYFTKAERIKLSVPIRSEHFEKVFGSLTKDQMDVVRAKTGANHLVIAGPGSGKTHVLVRRVFYLIKVRQEPPRAIAVLAYNRHAAIELRRRLKELLPRDWFEISVYTFHGLALRLVGRDRLHELQSDRKDAEEKQNNDSVFDQLLDELRAGLAEYQGGETHEQIRWLDRLGGIEYLLVDEFQDIGENEYEIIKLLGRLDSKNRENAVHVMAVGDDDQNIYAFRGTSVKWIRQFKSDFKADEPFKIPDNFRSVDSVIEVSARFIDRNESRLKPKGWKQRVPKACRIRVGKDVSRDPDKGKVVRLRVKDKAHARAAIAAEVEKIRQSFPDINLGDICIAHRTNAAAHLSKLLLDKRNIPSRVLGEHRFAPRFNIGVVELIRELQELDLDTSTESYSQLEARLNEVFIKHKIHESWKKTWESFFDPDLLDISRNDDISLKQMLWRIDEHFIGRSGNTIPPDYIANLTLHGTKGLEFHTVFLFPPDIRPDAEPDGIEGLRRLYFVGLSRAKTKLYMIDWPGCDSSLWDEITEGSEQWMIERETIGAIKEPSDEERELAEELRYFDCYKGGLGTGMNIYFVANRKR